MIVLQFTRVEVDKQVVKTVVGMDGQGIITSVIPNIKVLWDRVNNSRIMLTISAKLDTLFVFNSVRRNKRKLTGSKSQL